MGRFGLSVCRGGDYPAMLVWVTVGAGATFLWTWLGPDPAAEEIRAALEIVMTARVR
jgi:hypothetical protein